MSLLVRHIVKLMGSVIMGIALFVVLPNTAVSKSALLMPLNEEVFQDVVRNHFWQANRSRKMGNKEDVRDYLAVLNQGKYSDWRLPTKQELSQLFSAFDLKRNGNLKIRLEGNYWLTDDMGQTYVGTWEIGDQCGPSRAFYKGKAGYIRAIRP